MKFSIPLKWATGIFAGALLASSACTTESGKEDQGEKLTRFRYNQAEGLTSLDPAQAYNQANGRATHQLYNGLFKFTADLHEEKELVDSYEISEDGLTYTFNLKKGVFFHDNEAFPNGKGREMKASDVVYSFKRIYDPKVASPGAWIFNDKLHKKGNGAIDEEAIRATGDYTVQIVLNERFTPFLQMLGMPFLYIVPKEAVEKYGTDFGQNPVGTGPFKFKEWTEGNSLVLLKNENYWKRSVDNKQLPYLDAIQISFIPDKNQEFLKFKQGELDYVSDIDPNAFDQIINKDGSVRDDVAQEFQVQKVPFMATEYVGFNVDPSLYKSNKHPFLDKRVRKAFSMAVNREELVSFLRNSLGVPATNGFVPSAMPGFEPGRVKGYGFNPDEAKALLGQAGYANGKGFPKVTLYSTPNHRSAAEQLQKYWKDVLNVTVDVEINNFATHTELVNNGTAKMFRGSWIADYPDDENFLAVFFGGNHAPEGPNRTRYKNDNFDRLFDKVHHTTDGFERHDVYFELDQMIMDDAPVMVLYYDEILRLFQKDVEGIEEDRMNMLDLEKVRKS